MFSYIGAFLCCPHNLGRFRKWLKIAVFLKISFLERHAIKNSDESKDSSLFFLCFTFLPQASRSRFAERLAHTVGRKQVPAAFLIHPRLHQCVPLTVHGDILDILQWEAHPSTFVFGRIEKIDDILLAFAVARKREEPALRRGVAAGHVLWAEEDDDAGKSDRPAHPKSARQKSVKSITGANFFTKHASRLICCGFGIVSSITRSITQTAFGQQHANAQCIGRCARPDGARHAIFDKAVQHRVPIAADKISFQRYLSCAKTGIMELWPGARPERVS